MIFRTSTPSNVVGWLSGAIDVAISPIVLSRMSTSWAIAWSMKAIAKVATSITAGEAPRRGRKSARSITSESATTTTKQATMLQTTGQCAVKASVYAPAMISCP